MHITREIIQSLTPAELRVFCALQIDPAMSRDELAEMLGIAARTLRHHLSAIQAKGHAHQPPQAATELPVEPETAATELPVSADSGNSVAAHQPTTAATELPLGPKTATELPQEKNAHTNLLINLINNSEKEELKIKLGDGGVGEGGEPAGSAGSLAGLWAELWRANGVQVRITPRVRAETRRGLNEFGAADLERLIRGHAKSQFHIDQKLTSLRYATRETNSSRFFDLAEPRQREEKISWNDHHLQKTEEFWAARLASDWGPTSGIPAFGSRQPAEEAMVCGIRCFRWADDPKLSLLCAKLSAYRWAARGDHPPDWEQKNSAAIRDAKQELISALRSEGAHANV